MIELLKHLGHGQQPSASEYNRLTDMVTALMMSSNVQYFADSTGVHVRRMPSLSHRHKFAKGKHTTSTVVPNDTMTNLPLDYMYSDIGGWYDNINLGFEVPIAGLYFVSCSFYVNSAFTDIPAYIRLWADSSFQGISVQQRTSTTAGYQWFQASAMMILEPGDLVEYQFWHEAGVGNTLTVSNTGGTYAGLWLVEHLY